MTKSPKNRPAIRRKKPSAARPLSFYDSGDYGRIVELPATSNDEPYRTAFRRDYARIIHSPAFRRLQRKTQLFPGEESDFFRNRLTHSLEVAQIAKSIAIRLNYQIREKYGEEAGQIDLDLVELAGLAHDLGHPPFGHTGEHALHEKMHQCGGFEGNAQTLRILSKLEKRQTLDSRDNIPSFCEFANGMDRRVGLNLSFRSLAAVLKYDKPISLIGEKKLSKGYYKSETEVKKGVLGEQYEKRKDDEFRVVEMQIMDLADDIAYSTYDFEDALKAGFGSPVELLRQVSESEDIREAVGRKLFKLRTDRDFPTSDPSEDDSLILESIKEEMILRVMAMLSAMWREIDMALDGHDNREAEIAKVAIHAQKLSEEIARNGYLRAQFTSDLIGRRIREIGIEVDLQCPALSRVTIPDDVKFDIELLKHLTFELHIKSPRLKLIEYRGQQIVFDLFDCFSKDMTGDLMPHDWRDRLRAIRFFRDGAEMQKRLACDFIAGMTDAYALDVYSRLKTANPSALFRPF